MCIIAQLIRTLVIISILSLACFPASADELLNRWVEQRAPSIYLAPTSTTLPRPTAVSPWEGAGLHNPSALQQSAFIVSRAGNLNTIASKVSMGIRLGPNTLVDAGGQVYWPTNTRPLLDSPEAVDAAFDYVPAILEDMDRINSGTWNWQTSSLWSATGSYGFDKLRDLTLGLDSVGPGLKGFMNWSYGLDELAAGAGKQIGRNSVTPNIDELTHYLDAANKTAWGYVGGPVAAAAADFTAKVGRVATDPLFRELKMSSVRKQVQRDYDTLVRAWQATNQPIKSMAEVYTPQTLQEMGFGPEITGLPRPSASFPKLSSPRQPEMMPFQRVRTISLDYRMDDGFTRTSRTGLMREWETITVPRPSAIDRFLVRSGVIGPELLYDPMTSTMSWKRESHSVTHEITGNLSPTLPSGAFGQIYSSQFKPQIDFGQFSCPTIPLSTPTLNLPQYRPTFPTYTPTFNTFSVSFPQYKPFFSTYTPPRIDIRPLSFPTLR